MVERCPYYRGQQCGCKIRLLAHSHCNFWHRMLVMNPISTRYSLTMGIIKALLQVCCLRLHHSETSCTTRAVSTYSSLFYPFSIEPMEQRGSTNAGMDWNEMTGMNYWNNSQKKIKFPGSTGLIGHAVFSPDLRGS